MKKYDYKLQLDGIHCQSCVNKIGRVAKNIKIMEYRVDLGSKVMYVNTTNLPLLTKQLKRNGITVVEAEENVYDYRYYKMIGVVAAIALLLFIFFKVSPAFSIDENSSLAVIFLFGLINSVHCIAMCTPLYMAAMNSGKSNKDAAYEFVAGRIVSYTSVGAFLGLTGSMFTLNAKLLGVFMIAVGLLMVVFVLSQLGIVKFPLPKRVKLFKRLSPFKIGLSNAFVPCGLLTVVYLIALTQTDILRSALIMFVFSIATSTPFLFANFFKNKVSAKYSKIFQMVALLLVLFIATTTITDGYANIKPEPTPTINLDEVPNTQQLTINGYYKFEDQKITDENEQLFIAFDIQSISSCINRATITTPSGQTFDVDFRDKEEGIYVPLEKGEYKIACWMNMSRSSFVVE